MVCGIAGGGSHCGRGADYIKRISGLQVDGGDEFINFESPYAESLDASLTMTGVRTVWEAIAHDTDSHCEGFSIIEQQPIEKDLDVALEWPSELMPVYKNKKLRGYRADATVEAASISFGGTILTPPADDVALSCRRSDGVWIPTGTFD